MKKNILVSFLFILSKGIFADIILPDKQPTGITIVGQNYLPLVLIFLLSIAGMVFVYTLKKESK